MKRVVINGAESSISSASIDEQIKVLKTASLNDIDAYLAILNKCVNSFKEDYSKVPKGIEGLDLSYDDQKRYVYLHYKPLADECSKVLSELSISGYGKYDALKLKIQKLCHFVDYNFPYGWKNC